MIKEITLNNLGTVNKNEVVITTDKETFYLSFSYQTLVGISYYGHKAVIQNYWSTTTGKLLNDLEPDHKARLTDKEFKKEVDKMMKLINS